MDANALKPVFETDTYKRTLAETNVTGLPVVTVVASEGDTGVNSRITYYIASGAAATFSIETVQDGKAALGVITTTAALDFEGVQEYLLSIVATDGGTVPLLGFATVIVVVSDINDNGPVFTKAAYNATVSENLEIGSAVVFVSASDNDSGALGTITYSIVSGADGKFALVSASSGEIAVVGKLDFEVATSYSLIVRASDGGVPAQSAEVEVVITVTDYNDNAPAFSNEAEYTCAIEERLPGGQYCVTVQATDAVCYEVSTTSCPYTAWPSCLSCITVHVDYIVSPF